eukprot:m.340275 g.340275  ORF g.340275 m.340275 type:complete len:536 (-) comp19221_c0_seq1:1464-3071(-)
MSIKPVLAVLVVMLQCKYSLEFKIDNVVVTKQGPVQGIQEGTEIAYRGIPFAEPPLGERRWKPPQEATPWKQVRNATSWGNRCVQHNGDGDEDCLFVNVHTPITATKTSALPVLLWVHGGGYQDGDGNVNGSDLIESLKGRVVFASCNYRLNIFGFLGGEALKAGDSENSTGNYGIQDQRAAMKWVQQNIAEFGGDPTRVTIFGCSAGGGSMSNHLTMTRSAGLFSRMVIMSGSFATWVSKPMRDAEDMFQKTLNITGCKDVTCLQKLDVAKLKYAVETLPLCCSNLQGVPYIPWSPVIDGLELRMHPRALIAQGHITHVPVMHGTCRDEGAIFESLTFNTSHETLMKGFTSWYHNSLGSSAALELDKVYRNQTYPFNTSTLQATTSWWEAQRSLGDQSFNCPALYTSRELTRMSNLSVYEYFFVHPDNPQQLPLALHCSNMAYVFSISSRATEEERALALANAEYLYNFAASGDPNPPTQQTLLPTWPKWKNGEYMIMEVGSNGGMRAASHMKQQECAIMDEWAAIELNKTFFS